MPFIYWAEINGATNPCRLIPSPFVQISKEFQTTEDGTIVGTIFLINIKGKLTADCGSPDSTGAFWTQNGYPPNETINADSRLASIFRKQEALRALFSYQNAGKKLEFTPWDGSEPMWCNPRVKSIQFTEGQGIPWFNTCEYSIQMEADFLYTKGGELAEEMEFTAVVTGIANISPDPPCTACAVANGSLLFTHHGQSQWYSQQVVGCQGAVRGWHLSASGTTGLLQCNVSDPDPAYYTCSNFSSLSPNTFAYASGGTTMCATFPANIVVSPTGRAVYHISKATEEWNIESGDERARSFRLTHSLSAQGKRFFGGSGTLGKQAWENAKDYVLNKIGLGLKSDRMLASGVLNGSGLKAYNYVRSQHLNELGGSFQVTETWLCYDPGSGVPAIEDFTINIRTADNGISHVSCEGQIVGLEERNNTTYVKITDRYANATSKWSAVKSAVFGRCENISGLTLNPVALNLTEGHNEANGTISYNREYDDRAIPTTSGAVSELITIQTHNQADVFATIPVLGRAIGPVLQDIGTKTAKKTTIQMEIVMPAARIGYSPSQPNTDALLTSLLPGGYSVIYKENDEISWNQRAGRYSRSASFTWE